MRPLLPLSLAVTVVLAFASAAIALAHAEPDTVIPGADSVLTEPPAEIVILLSQEVARGDRTGIDVVNEAGAEVTTLDAVVDNGNYKRLSVLMPASLEPGVYTVRWKTLSSDDGDDASGEYSFTFDPNGTPDPGKTKLREDPLAPQSSATTETSAPVLIGDGGGGGTSWVLVAAVGVGMLTLGSGVTFLLVQKRG